MLVMYELCMYLPALAAFLAVLAALYAVGLGLVLALLTTGVRLATIVAFVMCSGVDTMEIVCGFAWKFCVSDFVSYLIYYVCVRWEIFTL